VGQELRLDDLPTLKHIMDAMLISPVLVFGFLEILAAEFSGCVPPGRFPTKMCLPASIGNRDQKR
jgi:hypothetical protein